VLVFLAIENNLCVKLDSYQESSEEVLHRDEEERNVVQTTRRKSNWLDHILHRNCLLKHVIEGKVEGKFEMKTMEKT